MTFVIRHYPSGDEAEAASMGGAVVAARTLVDDNDGEGFSKIYRAEQHLDTVSRAGEGWLHSRRGKADD